MYNHNDEEKESIPGNDHPPRPRHPMEDIQNDKGKPVDIPRGGGAKHPGQQPWTDRDPKKPVK